ncbi:unnamed protein product [Lactuca virosa]|uniref:Transcription repressor n=1 Tax=Lactuca virosa TaxID=75947 RepID=A0AAU9LWD2_9ASTR|nr:unnamed protein product [Lactuca virosa]
MANYRLKLSNFIYNSWFHKNKITKKQQSSSSSNPHTKDHLVADQRKSYYFPRDLTEDSPPPKTQSPETPRKSSKKRRPPTHKKPVQQKSVSGEHTLPRRCYCRVTPESIWTASNSSDIEFLSPELPVSSRESLSCSCNTTSSYDEVYGKVDLPPIITKSTKKEGLESGKWMIDGGSRSLSMKVVKEDVMETPTTHTTRSPVRRSTGGKVIKGNCYSPRVGNRVRVQGINGGGRRSNGYRRSLSESMAVVKTSVDPGRDFKESMVEMIMQNNMKSSKDLEDLLACYLLLNSDDYHDLIIKVFKQIWFESTDIRL